MELRSIVIIFAEFFPLVFIRNGTSGVNYVAKLKDQHYVAGALYYLLPCTCAK